MATSSICCICASTLSTVPEAYDPETEKPVQNRTLNCCGRTICAICIEKVPRLEAYCPFCQETRLPTLAQEQREQQRPQTPVEDPPPYSLLTPPSLRARRSPPPAPRMRFAMLGEGPDRAQAHPLPPPPYGFAVAEEVTINYELTVSTQSTHRLISAPEPRNPAPVIGDLAHYLLPDNDSQSTGRLPPVPEPLNPPPRVDVVHYLLPDDSLQSISLAYGVPTHILKTHNNLHIDYLLAARQLLRIPASHYQGPSLSPTPIEDSEEQERKSKIRRLMVKCKVSEYKVAQLYLEEAGWDSVIAEALIEADDGWERDHPFGGVGSSSSLATTRYGTGLRLPGPLSPQRIANLLS